MLFGIEMGTGLGPRISEVAASLKVTRDRLPLLGKVAPGAEPKVLRYLPPQPRYDWN